MPAYFDISTTITKYLNNSVKLRTKSVKRSKDLKSKNLTRHVWWWKTSDLLQMPILVEPTTSDLTALETSDQLADGQAPPSAGINSQ